MYAIVWRDNSRYALVFLLITNLLIRAATLTFSRQSVEVNTPGARRPNELFTFWQQSDVDLSRGLDFTPRGAIFARFTHLQHRPFSYKITVSEDEQLVAIEVTKVWLE